MRVLVKFLVPLCLFLLGGHQIRSTINRFNTGPLPQHLATSHYTPNTPTDTSLLQTKNLVSDSVLDFLIDVEDEDEDIGFARKYVLVTNYFSILSEIFTESDPGNHAKGIHPFIGHLCLTESDIYLRQRTLRI